MPVFNGPGQECKKAITLSKIVHSLLQQGQTEEASRVRREEQLPAYGRIPDERSRIIGRLQIGWDLILLRNAGPDERSAHYEWAMAEARADLKWALAEARRLWLPEVPEIKRRLDSLNSLP